MTDDRRQQLRALLATNGQAGLRVDRICGACVTTLDISGAGVTVLSKTVDGQAGDHQRGLVHASNPISAGLEELQLTVGEGPCVDTFATGGPILVPDLAADLARWPAFGPGAADLGAAAVFSFPLQIGAVRLGSLDLYRDRPGALTHDQVGDALLLADLATQAVVDQLDGHATSDLTWLADSHVEVHQAVGMVKVQLDITTDAALLRIRGHAFSHGLTLSHVARQIVARTLRFTPDEEPA